MEDKKNPIKPEFPPNEIVTNPLISINWKELGRWRSNKYLILGLLAVFILFFGSRSLVSYYDRMVEFWDAQIQVAEAARILAEEDQAVAEAEKVLIEEEAAEQDEAAEQEINSLMRNITTLRRSVSTLREANTVLQEELTLLPEEIISTDDETLASVIPPKIDEVYPDFAGSTLVFIPENNAFTGDRMFANAVLLSLNEVVSLRFTTENQQSIISDQDETIFSFQGVVTEKDTQIESWKVRYEASETLGDTKTNTILAFSTEKDAWEEKSRAQAKQIFWYKWGTRVGLGAAVGLGVYAATK